MDGDRAIEVTAVNDGEGWMGSSEKLGDISCFCFDGT